MNSSKSSKIYVVAFYIFLLVGWRSLYSFGKRKAAATATLWFK